MGERVQIQVPPRLCRALDRADARLSRSMVDEECERLLVQALDILSPGDNMQDMPIPSSPNDIIARLRASTSREMWCDQATALTLVSTGECYRVKGDAQGRVLVAVRS